MEKIYRIHPGIGIARVGKSDEGYFLEGDTITDNPYELNDSGPSQFKGYKDAAFQIRKQGARFRIFEYEKNANNEEVLIGEVTPDKATIKWTVTLGNGKAAGPKMETGTGLQEEEVIVPSPNNHRNESIINNREALHPISGPATLEGSNQPFKHLNAPIMGKTISLGSVGTDFTGNLIVLGGSGEAATWLDQTPKLRDFLNNDGWYDTTADGPITAELEFKDGSKLKVHHSSWVIVGPPDFAPGILPIVSLWDLMHDSLIRNKRMTKVTPVSYEQEILPVLKRAADYRWIHDDPTWDDILTLMTNNDLSSTSPDMKDNRQKAFSLLESNPLTGFKLTKTQQDYFKEWVAGNFVAKPTTPAPLPHSLDYASISRAIGSGLYPGIEMGFMASNENLYSEPARLTTLAFEDAPAGNEKITLRPGSVVQRMACPWQADFMDCSKNWWPAQRPDLSKFKLDGTPGKISWTRGLVSGGAEQKHLNMVKHFSDLGVIEEADINGKKLFVEKGRNPNIPH